MLDLMQCKHKKTKIKLVSWATTCKGQHEQGFLYKRCCVICGCEVKGA